MTVEVGQRYKGWDKTWVVTRVWKREGVAEIHNVDDDHNTARLPLTQFKTMEQQDDDGEDQVTNDDRLSSAWSMAPKRYEVIVSRRTSRGSSYTIYDNIAERIHDPHFTTRERSEAEAEAKRLSAGTP